MYSYFCRGCDTNIEYDKFEMIEQKQSSHTFIKCQLCKNQTCIIQCQACKQYKFKDISDQDALLSCTCGYKQRIFKCKGCSQVQCINSQELEQSTKIKCGCCQCQQYQINCPDCKTLNSTFQTDQMITCTKCSSQFFMTSCPYNQCKKETISKDQNMIKQFKCPSNHIFVALSCLRCIKISYFNNAQEITSFQCSGCKHNMRQILCQCGTKQFIVIQDNNTNQKYQCTKCRITFNLYPCNNNCDGYLSEIDVGIIQPSQSQTNFCRPTIVLCQKCRLRKVIVKCLRCQRSSIFDDQGSTLPGRCQECNRPFEDNLFPICAICQDKKVEILFSPCNHMVCCTQCSENLQQNKCIICRQFVQKQRVFFS